MGYVIQFIIGGAVMLTAAMLSHSKYVFLSGVITLLPILTLLNLNLQLHNMSDEVFRETQRNGILGAIGMVVLMVAIFGLSNYIRPVNAVLCGISVYVVYMVVAKGVFS